MEKWTVDEHPLAASQCAYKLGNSSDTGFHHLVSKVEVRLWAKGFASCSFLDIEGAFNSTSKMTIQQAMIRHEVPEAVVDWVEHMLAERNFIVNQGNTSIEGKPDQGCPQGGVLTPIL